MKDKRNPIAFVAHSFAPEDLPVVAATRDVIRRSGFSVSSGESPEARRVGEKVKARIKDSKVFVAIMTHRHYVGDRQLWTTNPWVIEEKGYSLGENPQRPVVVLVEEGIPVPSETGGLEGDLEIIFFNRAQFDAARTKLRQVLAGMKA